MPDIQLAIEDGIAHFRLDRPALFNALSPDLLQELIDLCADIAANDACRVVVLEGVGEHFSAGADSDSSTPIGALISCVSAIVESDFTVENKVAGGLHAGCSVVM